MKLTLLGKLLIILILIPIVLFIAFKQMKPDLIKEVRMSDPVPFPTELHPIVKERSDQLIQQAANKGIEILITDDFRSAEDQDRLYELGRSVEGNIVTNAKGGESYHNFGLAVDFAIKTPSGDVIWDMQYDGNKNGKPDWNEVVKLAKTLGFEWGGDWSQFKDFPHLQMNFGLTVAELQNGKRPADTTLTADTN
jgi:peptidoglycan LD-endopeptidase CwlK